MQQNETLLQFFHWYYDDPLPLWNKLKAEAKNLAAAGITAVWLPPAYKASTGGYSVGYDVYDMYDLGEFDQKSSVKTRYGSKAEYLDAIKTAKLAGIKIYADIVVNHMGGADEKEIIKAVKVDSENRTQVIGEPQDIEAYTKFTFPGRNKKYSDFIWDFRCFSGVDYDDATKETAIFKILNDFGEAWEDMVDEEKGNYDYLMYADIDFRNPAVRATLKHWGKWYWDMIQFDGVRLDAVKHISPKFYNEWLGELRASTGQNFFAVGEYWAPGDLTSHIKYIDATEGKMSLFDAPLHHNFHVASKAGKDYDLATIFNESLVSVNPLLAVTVVDNHDTQPLQALEAPVEHWFKPIAYALILLRIDGYPCVFYPDMFGAHYTDKGQDGENHEISLEPCEHIYELLSARKLFSYGEQRDYFDHNNCIGWTRAGVDENPGSGCAVLLSNGDDGFKKMEVGKKFAGKKFVDYLGKQPGEITIDKNGWGEFNCAAGSVAVWVEKQK